VGRLCHHVTVEAQPPLYTNYPRRAPASAPRGPRRYRLPPGGDDGSSGAGASRGASQAAIAEAQVCLPYCTRVPRERPRRTESAPAVVAPVTVVYRATNLPTRTPFISRDTEVVVTIMPFRSTLS